MENLMKIGRHIVKLRKEQSISQEQLALTCEISTSRLREIEHGGGNPSWDYLTNIAHGLNTDMPHLLSVIYEMDNDEDK